ncbi:hypothetical protein B0H11DRAFT_2299127 [Mycena galericulata]|nr:hypothetical protein B0H11DRAFT_2299127 [Mycena galericulata]
MNLLVHHFNSMINSQIFSIILPLASPQNPSASFGTATSFLHPLHPNSPAFAPTFARWPSLPARLRARGLRGYALSALRLESSDFSAVAAIAGTRASTPLFPCLFLLPRNLAVQVFLHINTTSLIMCACESLCNCSELMPTMNQQSTLHRWMQTGPRVGRRDLADGVRLLGWEAEVEMVTAAAVPARIPLFPLLFLLAPPPPQELAVGDKPPPPPPDPGPWPAAFHAAFYTQVWCTYHVSFEPIRDLPGLSALPPLLAFFIFCGSGGRVAVALPQPERLAIVLAFALSLLLLPVPLFRAPSLTHTSNAHPSSSPNTAS